MIPLGNKGEGSRGIRAKCLGHDRTGAIYSRFKVAKLCARPRIGCRLNHGVRDRSHPYRAKILGDRAVNVKKVSGRVVGRRVPKVDGISKCSRGLPLRLWVEIRDGEGGNDSPAIEANIGEIVRAV